MDAERIARVQRSLGCSQLDALVCARPANVLLLSGYWPVIGSSIVIATREGAVALVAPEDELDFARQGWASEIRSFQGGSLDNLAGIPQVIGGPLRDLCKLLGLNSMSSIGVERSASFDLSSYVSTFVYGSEIDSLLYAAFPSVSILDASLLLEELRSALTPDELEIVRGACALAGEAFRATAAELHAGMAEFEAGGHLQRRLNRGVMHGRRCGGFAYCMSGPNSAQAYAAYQQSRDRALAPDDFVLLHCNSYIGGLWTDITRTFSSPAGAGNEGKRRQLRGAVLEARQAALEAVKPGIKACAVDRAARRVLQAHGFGKEFRHATGHGVGFAAINHNAKPRIHPLSSDILEPGMVFNIEPAVYIPGCGGMRHCDMVAVGAGGAELLTPFQQTEAELTVCL